MSIKVRLIVSYIIMMIVPVILTFVVAFFTIRFYGPDILRTYGDFSGRPIKNNFGEIDRIYSEIRSISLNEPQQLENNEFLHKLESEIQAYNTGIVIRKNDEVIYLSPMLEGVIKEVHLPQFSRFTQNIVPSEKIILNQHDFYFPDNSEGSIFYAVNIKPLKKALHSSLNTLLISSVVIFIITNIILTYTVAGSIIKPLDKLKTSANQIKEGDLDFEITHYTKDEIGEVNKAFEEMRERLKSSIDKQLKYEENRKELISNISHDLKTPITIIKGYIEGIRDGVADTPEKMDKYINTIYSKAEDLDRLIDELFLYSKLDLSKLPLNLTRIKIYDFIEDIVEELKFDLEKKQINITIEKYFEGSMEVIADIQNLKRVIVNIVENAAKYMDREKGCIKLVLSEDEMFITIEVKDNGVGISSKDLPYIFDRFYRVDQSRNTESASSGLGLAIAKRIIEGHGGIMWAKSTIGQGTSIYFTLKKYEG